jgi:paraquat-inducible protein B
VAKKTNPRMIGGFVVGAIALAVLGVLAFGGTSFLHQKQRAVLYFSGSLGGLNVGAPVTFRGIPVGTVTDIRIQYDVNKHTLHIPVFVQVDSSKFEITSGERKSSNILDLVKRGLRAQLEMQSFVTGQVSVDFDFHPDAPIVLVGGEPGMLELPTVPSQLSQLKSSVASLLEKVNKLPLDKIVDEAGSVLQSANHTLNDLDGQVRPLSESVQGTSEQANQLLANINAQVKPLAESLESTSDHANRLLTTATAGLPQLLSGAKQVMKSANVALSQADQTLRTAQGSIAPTSPLFYEINGTLSEIRSAARSLRNLAEYLERNPNAVLTGKR